MGILGVEDWKLNGRRFVDNRITEKRWKTGSTGCNGIRTQISLMGTDNTDFFPTKSLLSAQSVLGGHHPSYGIAEEASIIAVATLRGI